MVLTKADPGEKFDIKGKLIDKIRVRMVIDGYNAPITGTTKPALLPYLPALPDSPLGCCCCRGVRQAATSWTW